MRPRKDTAPKQRSHTGHMAFFYDSADERKRLLANYFQMGLERGELCILITPVSTPQIMEDFLSAGFDATGAGGKGDLKIFKTDAAYLSGGEFSAKFMLTSVTDFIENATSRGYKGLRTAGEMEWVYDHPQFAAEAEMYEDAINTLGEDYPNFTDLCLYPVRHQDLAVIKNVVYTHPVFIYRGRSIPNTLYRRKEDDMEAADLANARAIRDIMAQWT